MSLSSWLIVWQARELIRLGQLDAAEQLVAPHAEGGHRRGLRVRREIARAHQAKAATLAKSLAAGDDAGPAWAALLAAERLGFEAADTRAQLAAFDTTACADALATAAPVRAQRLAARLREYGVRNQALAELGEAAAAWLAASQRADRGEFAAAGEVIAPFDASASLPQAAREAVGRFRAALAERGQRFQGGMRGLSQAAAAHDWPEVVCHADGLLALAPDHAEVRSLRAKAWAALQPDSRLAAISAPAELAVTATYPSAALQAKSTAYFPEGVELPATSNGSASRSRGRFSTGAGHTPGTPLPKRFMLWVDGVGGYLVCLGSRVTVGQAIGEAPVDVPVFAELARLHAEISRDGEGGYVLDAARDATVNGQPATRSALSTQDRITLGASCQFLFQRPVAISATARLDVVSGHRLPWAVDGIILMDQALLLGVGELAHLTLPDDDAAATTLYRTPEGLAIKTAGRFRVDNRPCEGRAELPLPSVVTGDGFTLALEPIGPRV